MGKPLTSRRRGSPPRVRGEAHRQERRADRERITPACAGRRRLRASVLRRDGDHPRVCGEKSMSTLRKRRFLGSPPRVRGEAYTERRTTRRAGITPACAGRSEALERMRRLDEDHPRVCGEKSNTISRRSTSIGSPPRVRGEVGFRQLGGTVHGITPACAGRRHISYNHFSVYRDHPRVCGEKGLSTVSRPPMYGITPACAGRRDRCLEQAQHDVDHPRVCGEKICSSLISRWLVGSPPRVRGEVASIYKCDYNKRITPACAGRRGQAPRAR